MKKIVAFLTLFSSTSTLLCCALPALFVALGSGAVFAALVTKIPSLIFISEHKIFLFVFAGAMLFVSGLLQFRATQTECPINPELREACVTSKGWSKSMWFISVAVYAIGVFFAFIVSLIF